MKIQKISNWLKGMIILLAVMGIVFFGGVTVYAFSLKAAQPDSLQWTFVFFSWYTAVLCYMVLFQFGKVCREIGADNSFSMENAASFHKMGMYGVAAGAGYLVRMLFQLLTGSGSIWATGYAVFMMLVAVVFFILCEALSKLIQNAYEVKQENELTI